MKIDLPANPQIRSGLFGRARFPRGERQSILVPQTAVLSRGQLQAVYVVGKDQLASLRYVTLGAASAQQVEVLSGLEAGDQIVAAAGRPRVERQEGRSEVMAETKTPMRIAGAIASHFINSKLTPLFVAASLLLGAFAIWKTPREEEPQIVVPMLDVFVQMPGATPAEVEQRASIPMERLLREVPGVEYVYSISQPGMSLLVVRFYVGTKEEDAIVKTYNKLYSNFDRIPQGVSQPLIKVRSIDDVPIMALTLWGKNYDSYQLRQIAGELENQLKQLDNVSETKIIGGLPRQVRVTLDTQKLAAYGMTPGAVVAQLQQANARGDAGSFARDNQQFAVEAGRFLGSANDLQQIVVGVHQGHPVYLRDVAASITDGPAEPQDYVLYANGSSDSHSFVNARMSGAPDSRAPGEYPAVTITLAKRKGTNATDITQAAEKKIDSLRGYLLPPDLNVTVTRNYGETAKDKSNELLKHLLLATLSVTLLIALALGWRESGVVLIAIPVTLALTLFIFYFFGYTLNRVTLFALIFSIGILVDDAIVVVENIVRHFRMPASRGRPLSEVAVEAVDEVGNPTILATFAVIAAILPMAFVRGLMGPYMRPIPVGASAAMLFSLIVAFIVSPWSALRLLRHYAERVTNEHEAEGWTTRLYRRIMDPLVAHAKTALAISWRHGCAAAAGLLAGGVQAGQSQDAALRQQERVPGHR